MAWRKSPPALVALFDEVVPQAPSVERRKMFGYPAAFANGNLFMGLHQESFILKLPEADRAKIVEEHGAGAFEPMPGRLMREYVVLPDALLRDRRALKHWLAKSLDYAEAIRPRAKSKAGAKAKPAAPRARALGGMRSHRD